MHKQHVPSAVSGEFRRAVDSQPENLEAARDAFAEAVLGIDLKPFRRGTIVFSGVGASAHALTPAVLSLRAAGRRAVAIPPAELRDVRDAGLGEAYVLVSQSGASTETLEALEYLDGAPVVAIAAEGDSPLAVAAGAWLPLGPLRDTPVATLSYTATLQALALLVDALVGTASAGPELAALASEVLERSDPLTLRAAEQFSGVLTVDAVGGASAQASARETALLVREGLRLPALGMETREYLHGPLEAVGGGFGCVVFGRKRELELGAELAGFGATVTGITDEDASSTSEIQTIRIPQVPDVVAPILQILPVQLLVGHMARLRGLEIGELRRHQPDTKVA